MSLRETWAPYFQSEIRRRGQAYFRDGRVSRIAPLQDEWLRAEVQGNTRYTVTIKGQGSTAVANCTCPHFEKGLYCKHIWATLLDAQENPPEPDDETNLIEQANPQPLKARKRSTDAVVNRHAHPQWFQQLELLRAAAGHWGKPSSDSLFPNPIQVCYYLRCDLSTQHGGLVIELRQRQKLRSGWGRIKKLPINSGLISQLPDETDRALCATLLGASRLEAYDTSFYDKAYERRHHIYMIPAELQHAMLARLTQTGRCFVVTDESFTDGVSLPLRWHDNNPWTLWLVGQLQEDGLQIESQLRCGDDRMSIQRPLLVVGGTGGVVIDEGRAWPFDDRGAYRWVVQFRGMGRFSGGSRSIHVPTGDIPRFLDFLYRLPHLPEMDLPADIDHVRHAHKPFPHMEWTRRSQADHVAAEGDSNNGQTVAKVWFDYGQHRVAAGQSGRYITADTPRAAVGHTPHPDRTSPSPNDRPGHHTDESEQTQGAYVIERDLVLERETLQLLVPLGFRAHPIDGDDATLSLPNRLKPAAIRWLLDAGWGVSHDQQPVVRSHTVNLSVTSGIDWFELHGQVHYETAHGGVDVALPEILAAVKAGQSVIQLEDGSQGLLPEQWFGKDSFLMAIGELDGDHLKFKSSQAAILDLLLSQLPTLDVDETFGLARERVRQFQGVHPIEPIATFRGKLRPYQKEGLGWFEFLRWLGVGGILADDMGLGKTVQVLAMLESRYTPPESEPDPQTQRQEHRPSLVIVPRSLVYNWIDEAQRFAPNLRVQSYTGSDRQLLRKAFADHDVVVTSYGLLRRDITQLCEHAFDYVVLDEAQVIKNPGSQAAKSVRLLNARHRLALTGTPVENHLGDLWSIFEFLIPGMLGSHTKFARMIRSTTRQTRLGAMNLVPTGGENERNHPKISRPPPGTIDSGISQIASALRPFILRRTKQQVLKDLPAKTEQTIMCQLEPKQRQTYDQLMMHYRQTLFRSLDAVPGRRVGGSTMVVLEALLRLRQVACHPGLIDPARCDEPAAKLDVLLDRVHDLIEEGHKALVFSQFTSMLDLVRRSFERHDIVYEYLDGQTRDRKERVERFQNDPDCPVFLISLKAGGLGLNLTAAEYVFILDPWWNPAAETQAIDRTHRIGQTRHVFAYRLICEDTIEQRIAELQARKRDLAEAIVGEQETPLRDLTRQDLEFLLS